MSCGITLASPLDRQREMSRVMTPKEAAEKALKDAGFQQDKERPHRWTRPNKAEWVGTDELTLLPYDGGQRYLATMTLYVHDQDLPALLNPISLEEIGHAVDETLHVFRRKARRGQITLDPDDDALWEDVRSTILSRLQPTKEG